MADNIHIDVNGEGIERLTAVFKLFPQKTAMAFAIAQPNPNPPESWVKPRPVHRIAFFWTHHAESVGLPAPTEPDVMARFSLDWLKTIEYPPQPDHDGDNEKGWRCFNEEWGHVAPFGYQAFAAVEPCWMMYGK